MNKKNILWAILNLIFLVIFNIIFFMLGKESAGQNASVWISYGFIHFAYLMLLFTPKLIREGKSAAVFGFSIYSISGAYFLLEFFTGVIFILISPESYKAALIIQLCIAGFYGILLVSNLLANEYTADSQEKRQHQISYIRDASAQLKGLLDKVSDKEAAKKVEQVYDTLNSSPVKSYPELAQKENNILQTINELKHAISIGNKEEVISLANSLLLLINERNTLLKSFH